MPKKKILVADDATERSLKGRLRSRLLREASIEMARALNLSVELLYVKDLNPRFLDKRNLIGLTEAYPTLQSSFKDQLFKAGVEGQVIIKAGYPADQILNTLQMTENVSYLAMATQGRTGLRHFVLGSVSEEVLRHTDIPVLSLGPTFQKSRKDFKIDDAFSLLVLTDLSINSRAAENEALKIAKKLKCPVTLAYCVGEQIMKTRQNIYMAGYVPFDLEKMFRNMTAEGKRNLLVLQKKFKREGIPCQGFVYPKEESIEKTLSGLYKKYGAIVMGTHGRNKLMRAFLGSTARQVLLKSPIPVIIVRGE